jgi:hypothetical protein
LQSTDEEQQQGFNYTSSSHQATYNHNRKAYSVQSPCYVTAAAFTQDVGNIYLAGCLMYDQRQWGLLHRLRSTIALQC